MSENEPKADASKTPELEQRVKSLEDQLDFLRRVFQEQAARAQLQFGTLHDICLLKELYTHEEFEAALIAYKQKGMENLMEKRRKEFLAGRGPK